MPVDLGQFDAASGRKLAKVGATVRSRVGAGNWGEELGR
jgi:hypothetical protein